MHTGSSGATKMCQKLLQTSPTMIHEKVTPSQTADRLVTAMDKKLQVPPLTYVLKPFTQQGLVDVAVNHELELQLGSEATKHRVGHDGLLWVGKPSSKPKVSVKRPAHAGLDEWWHDQLIDRQVEWAARVLRLELLICATLGVTTFLVWSTINVVKYIELMDPHEYNRIKTKVWFYVQILRRADGALNAVELAFLSGILWQGKPPEEDDTEMETRSRLRGLTSMSDFLEVDEQLLYHAKVEQLAHRGFHLGRLLQFWEQLLDGELMPSFDPKRSQTNDVVRQAIIPGSRCGSGGMALASIWEENEVLPQSMVTHNWTNTFAHLVGAMVTDALKGDVYADISELLTRQEGAGWPDLEKIFMFFPCL
eukprot:g15301.t1